MRIARIIEYFVPEPGGMERHALKLSEEQVKLGHEVDLYFSYGDKNLAKGITAHQFKIPAIFYKNKLGRILFNFLAKNQVIRNHHANPYSMVHLHGDFLEGWIGGILARKIKIPAILTIHAGLNKKLVKRQFSFFFDGLSHIICASQEIKNDLELMGVNLDKISVIPSGILLQEFNEASQGDVSAIKDSYSRPIIISIGTLRINKGFNYLIEAFRKICESVPGASLLIIGNGPEEKHLKNQTKDLRNVYFLGALKHHEIVNYLKAGDIFVLASISTPSDREGTPTSIMEAMAAGLPIVATKVGGTSYLVKNGENGLVVGEKDTDALARAIIRLIGDQNLREKMSRQNTLDIKEQDWPSIVAKVINIYKSVL